MQTNRVFTVMVVVIASLLIAVAVSAHSVTNGTALKNVIVGSVAATIPTVPTVPTVPGLPTVTPTSAVMPPATAVPTATKIPSALIPQVEPTRHTLYLPLVVN